MKTISALLTAWMIILQSIFAGQLKVIHDRAKTTKMPAYYLDENNTWPVNQHG